MIKRRQSGLKFLAVLTAVSVACCACWGRARGEDISYNLAGNYKDFEEIFAAQEIEAEIIIEDGTEYLSLTFPDCSRALYQEHLERIEWELEREDEDGSRSAELVITMDEKDGIADVIIWIGEDEEGITGGSTGGEFVLPDFSEMLPDRSARADDVSILLSIERWISREQMSALYQRAKDIEYKMISMERNRMTEGGEG